MPEQPSLFEGTEQAAASDAHSRAEFLTGMLATWLLGDKKPNTMQREELTRLSRRYLADCDMVVNVHRAI